MCIIRADQLAHKHASVVTKQVEQMQEPSCMLKAIFQASCPHLNSITRRFVCNSLEAINKGKNPDSQPKCIVLEVIETYPTPKKLPQCI